MMPDNAKPADESTDKPIPVAEQKAAGIPADQTVTVADQKAGVPPPDLGAVSADDDARQPDINVGGGADNPLGVVKSASNESAALPPTALSGAATAHGLLDRIREEADVAGDEDADHAGVLARIKAMAERGMDHLERVLPEGAAAQARHQADKI